jgi:hypothetical protein
MACRVAVTANCEMARKARDAAEVEHGRAQDPTSAVDAHRAAEATYLKAAEVHDRAAKLFDGHDDPNVAERDAIRLADEAVGEASGRKPWPR